MPAKRVKRPLPGFSGLSSHQIVYETVGQGVPHGRPLMRPCVLLSVLVMGMVAFVVKSF